MKDDYRTDYEMVARSFDPLRTIELLAEIPNGFDRDLECFACENWQLKQGLANMPKRPGNPNALLTCRGCIYAMLDHKSDPPPRPPKANPFPVKPQASREKAEEKPSKPERPRRRVLLLDGQKIRFKAGELRTEVVGGYVGKRDRHRAEDRARRSFRPRRHTVEKDECPKCGAFCEVQRYWYTNKKKLDPIEMLLLVCKKCGRYRRPAE